MKGKYSIRDFKPGDAEKILRRRQETAKASFPGLRLDREKAKKAILSHRKRHPGTIKIAESRGRLAGYIMFCPRTSSLGRYGCINTIFVEKGHRKHGVGALLLKEAEKWFRSRGIRRIQATVTATNRLSLGFFRERGYREKRLVVEKRVDSGKTA